MYNLMQLGYGSWSSIIIQVGRKQMNHIENQVLAWICAACHCPSQVLPGLVILTGFSCNLASAWLLAFLKCKPQHLIFSLKPSAALHCLQDVAPACWHGTVLPIHKLIFCQPVFSFHTPATINCYRSQDLHASTHSALAMCSSFSWDIILLCLLSILL